MIRLFWRHLLLYSAVGWALATVAACVAAAEIRIEGATAIAIGDYTLALDGSTTVWLDPDRKSVRVGSMVPSPPVPPKPTPEPVPEPSTPADLLTITAEASRMTRSLSAGERAELRIVFTSIRVGFDARTEDELSAITSERLRTAAGERWAAWKAALEPVFAECNRLRDRGVIRNMNDWAYAWAAIVEGLR